MKNRIFRINMDKSKCDRSHLLKIKAVLPLIPNPISAREREKYAKSYH